MRISPLAYGIFVCIFCACISCNSMSKDARKAAKFTNESIRQMHELKFDEAEKSFNKAQKIIRKYNENGKFEDFLPEYRRYRDKERRRVSEEDLKY
jgi:hypothetical protein